MAGKFFQNSTPTNMASESFKVLNFDILNGILIVSTKLVFSCLVFVSKFVEVFNTGVKGEILNLKYLKKLIG